MKNQKEIIEAALLKIAYYFKVWLKTDQPSKVAHALAYDSSTEVLKNLLQLSSMLREKEVIERIEIQPMNWEGLSVERQLGYRQAMAYFKQCLSPKKSMNDKLRITGSNVEDLIHVLRTLPQDSKVILAVDEEQNALADDILIEEGDNIVTLLPLNPTTPEDL